MSVYNFRGKKNHWFVLMTGLKADCWELSGLQERCRTAESGRISMSCCSQHQSIIIQAYTPGCAV